MAYNSFINKQVNANQPIFQFKKDRNNATVVVADGLGNIQFQGFDGTNYLTTSQILSVASGTIAANRIGSNLEFYTHPDSVTASTQCMVIESTGQVQINNPSSNVASLFVTNDQSAPNINLRTANATAANSPHIHFTRSKVGTADVLAADDLGRLEFRGYQGGVAIEAATIRSQAETVNGASVSGNFQFLTRPTTYAALTTRMNISADGAVSILNTVAGNIALTVNATATGGVEVQQNAAANAGMRIYTSLGNINGPRFEMLKSRSGGNVVANDNIGQFLAYGYQTGYQNAAQILFKAESVAASRVSGSIGFITTSLASISATRLNISADGAVTIPATVAGNVPLTITGTTSGGLTINQTPVATALTLNGTSTAGTHAQQNNAYVTSGLFSAFRALNVDGTAGGSCQIEVSVFNQLAATGGDATLLFGNYGGTNIKIGNDVSVNQFSMSTGNLGDAGTFFSYNVATTQINLPRQCSFMARKSATSLNVTGANTVTVVFDAESFDVSNSYNNATGIFTAPKTGKYFFYATVRIEALTALMTAGQISIVATGQSIFSNLTNLAISRTITPNDINTMQVSGIISMTTGDTAQVQVTVLNGAGNTASIYGGPAAVNSTYFSGQLLS